MPADKPSSVSRFARACFLILGAVIALVIAVELLRAIWRVLLIIGIIILLVFVAFRYYQWKSDWD